MRSNPLEALFDTLDRRARPEDVARLVHGALCSGQSSLRAAPPLAS
jgi:hypothetical protein